MKVHTEDKPTTVSVNKDLPSSKSDDSINLDIQNELQKKKMAIKDLKKKNKALKKSKKDGGCKSAKHHHDDQHPKKCSTCELKKKIKETKEAIAIAEAHHHHKHHKNHFAEMEQQSKLTNLVDLLVNDTVAKISQPSADLNIIN